MGKTYVNSSIKIKPNGGIANEATGLAVDLSNIFLTSLTKSFVAGESIAAGDSVAMMTGTTLTLSRTTKNNNYTFSANTDAFFQVFESLGTTVNYVKLWTSDPFNDNNRDIRCEIRAESGGKPTGAALGMGYVSSTVSNGGTGFERTYTFSTPIPVVRGTKYCIVCTTANTNGSINIASDDAKYSLGTSGSSNNSGSTWTIDSGRDFYFVVNQNLATGKVYKSSGLNQFNLSSNFIGLAVESKNLNDNIKITHTGIDTSKTGLTPGSTYYLSDTSGAIAASAGNFSKKIGLALSATELLLIRDNE